MTISAIQEGEVLTIRVYKSYYGWAWANTYEARAKGTYVNSTQAVEQLAASFVSLEVPIHIEGVMIDRLVVSTYVPDGRPYDPETFITVPYSISGTRQPPAEVLPLELALFVRRDTVTGRDGRLLYRGCLTEADMSAGAFRPALTSPAQNFFQNIFSTWFSSTFPSSAWDLVLASGRSEVNNVRPVRNLIVSNKITVKKLNNRYYDRQRST